MTVNTALPSSRLAALALFAEMELIDNIDVFLNGVTEEDVNYDDDGKVHGYAVLWSGAGNAPNARLNRQPDHKAWSFQITTVGGDTNRCLWVADKIEGAVPGLRLSFSGGRASPIFQEIGPDRVEKDDGVDPPRFMLPLLFSCRISNQ